MVGDVVAIVVAAVLFKIYKNNKLKLFELNFSREAFLVWTYVVGVVVPIVVGAVLFLNWGKKGF